jgi:hypothetical protein
MEPGLRAVARREFEQIERLDKLVVGAGVERDATVASPAPVAQSMEWASATA